MLTRRSLLLTCALGPVAASVPDDELSRAFTRMYNFDFKGAHSWIDKVLHRDPGSPMGHVSRASALLFEEMNRLGVLQADFFMNDDRIAEKKKLKADENVRKAFYDATGIARANAEKQLAQNQKDVHALFALSLAYGVMTDYAAFIEKRQIGSLSYAKTAQQYAVRMLAIDPSFADAYLTCGISEYVLGSLPFFVKWFVKFDQATGSKEQAITNLKRVAKDGKYLGPFARILLAVVALREKKKHEARMWLEGLVKDYPENPLLRQELARLSPSIR